MNVIDIPDDAGDPNSPEAVNPLLTPEVMARRVRIGKAMREEHIKKTVKTPGARRRQLRFKMFCTVYRDPLLSAHEQVTLQGLIQRFRGHALPPVDKLTPLPDGSQPYVSGAAQAALENKAADLRRTLEAIEEDAEPDTSYRIPQNVINVALASFYIRMIIGNRARAQNPKLPKWPPSEAELDRAEAERKMTHPMDRVPGNMTQWLATVGQGRSIADLCKEAFSGR